MTTSIISNVRESHGQTRNNIQPSLFFLLTAIAQSVRVTFRRVSVILKRLSGSIPCKMKPKDSFGSGTFYARLFLPQCLRFGRPPFAPFLRACAALRPPAAEPPRLPPSTMRAKISTSVLPLCFISSTMAFHPNTFPISRAGKAGQSIPPETPSSFAPLSSDMLKASEAERDSGESPLIDLRKHHAVGLAPALKANRMISCSSIARCRFDTSSPTCRRGKRISFESTRRYCHRAPDMGRAGARSGIRLTMPCQAPWNIRQRRHQRPSLQWLHTCRDAGSETCWFRERFVLSYARSKTQGASVVKRKVKLFLP